MKHSGLLKVYLQTRMCNTRSDNICMTAGYPPDIRTYVYMTVPVKACNHKRYTIFFSYTYIRQHSIGTENVPFAKEGEGVWFKRESA